MKHGKRSGAIVALGLLLAGTSAFGSFGAHYLGTSRDAGEFRLYLDGGEFLGRNASFQSIGVTVHQLRQGKSSRTIEGCVYRFDDRDRSKDRIECAETTRAPLSGVVYVRDKAHATGREAEVDPMVCVRRCSPRVPQRLGLEAENDNK